MQNGERVCYVSHVIGRLVYKIDIYNLAKRTAPSLKQTVNTLEKIISKTKQLHIICIVK